MRRIFSSFPLQRLRRVSFFRRRGLSAPFPPTPTAEVRPPYFSYQFRTGVNFWLMFGPSVFSDPTPIKEQGELVPFNHDTLLSGTFPPEQDDIVMPSDKPPSERLSYWGAVLFLMLLSVITSEAEAEVRDEREASVPSHPRITNLVFKGGGPKGLAYIGVLESLEQKCGEDLPEVKRIAGASAGAITAALLSVGYRSKEIREEVSTEVMLLFLTDGLSEGEKAVVASLLDAHEAGGSGYFPYPKIHVGLSFVKQVLFHPIDSSRLVYGVFKNKGLSKGQYFRDWLNDLLKKKVVAIELERLSGQPGFDRAQKKKELSEHYTDLTFGQLAQLIAAEENEETHHYKHLYVIEAHHASESGKVFQRISTSEVREGYRDEGVEYLPDLIIADAVRCSMSIPIAFTTATRQFKDQEGVLSADATGIDGGVLENYPYRLFDRQHYLTHPDPTKSPQDPVKNHETLGFILYDKRHMTTWEWAKHEGRVIRSTGQYGDADKAEDKGHYANAYVEKLIALGMKKETEAEEVEPPRHVLIDNCGVSLVSFKLPLERQEDLMASGKKAMQLFFADEGNALQKHQRQKEAQHQAAFQARLKTFGEWANIEGHIHRSDYVETHHYRELQRTFFLKGSPGLNRMALVGMSGMGKSELACYGAQEYLKQHFWHLWRLGKLNADSKIHVWIFDATNSDTLWNSFRALPKAIGGSIDAQATPTPAALRDLQHSLTHYPDFLWVFDNVTDESVFYFQEKVGGQKYAFLPPPLTSGHVWVTTQNPISSFNAKINLNDGLRVREARALLSRFMQGEDEEGVDCVAREMGYVPLGIVVAGEFMKQQSIGSAEFLTLFATSKAQLAKRVPGLFQKLDYRGGSVVATLMNINRLSEGGKEEAREILDLLFICSKLNISYLPEVLLRDYVRYQHPDFKEGYLGVHLKTLIDQSGSLLIEVNQKGGKAYRMPALIKEVLNDEWKLQDPFFSGEYVAKQNISLNRAAKLLCRHFSSKDMIQTKVFQQNLLFLPQVNALLSFFPQEQTVDLVNAFLPLYKTRCFMYLAMGNKRVEVPAEAIRLKKILAQHAGVDESRDSPETLYKKLSAVNAEWPRDYAALLYILGRVDIYRVSGSMPVSVSGVEKNSRYFNDCIALCSVIEKQTGKCPDYRYLSKRSLLSLYSHALDSISDIGILETLWRDYEKLLLDETSYLTEEGEPRRFDQDTFNARVCRRALASIGVVLGAAWVNKGNLAEGRAYFEKATQALLGLLPPMDEATPRYELEAQNYNVLASVYFHRKNPDRNLGEAKKYYRKAYEIELVKNEGKGKRDFPLADAAYGLAQIALEQGHLPRARRYAELCLSIRGEIGSSKLTDTKTLLEEINVKQSASKEVSASPSSLFAVPNSEDHKKETRVDDTDEKESVTAEDSRETDVTQTVS